MKILAYLTISILILNSCVSEKELLNHIENKNNNPILEFNSTFYNKNRNKNTYQSLHQILNYQKKHNLFKNKINDLKYDSNGVNISYNGLNSLNISYKDSTDNIINYELKVKSKGNYLTFKRKFKFIPIPFLFTYYWNEKTIIYFDDDNNINFLSGQNQFVWIFLAGGGKNVIENKFELIN